jgi:hypothetical protein
MFSFSDMRLISTIRFDLQQGPRKGRWPGGLGCRLATAPQAVHRGRQNCHCGATQSVRPGDQRRGAANCGSGKARSFVPPYPVRREGVRQRHDRILRLQPGPEVGREDGAITSCERLGGTVRSPGRNSEWMTKLVATVVRGKEDSLAVVGTLADSVSPLGLKLFLGNAALKQQSSSRQECHGTRRRPRINLWHCWPCDRGGGACGKHEQKAGSLPNPCEHWQNKTTKPLRFHSGSPFSKMNDTDVSKSVGCTFYQCSPGPSIKMQTFPPQGRRVPVRCRFCRRSTSVLRNLRCAGRRDLVETAG